ncbi:MAG: zf-HC2 domain-containing protein [Gemmatimonadetes bacterium]|nr:zf-HC2 domain-containing protein [Gemmatimonadota bacterium]
MKPGDCARMQDLLPARAAGRLSTPELQELDAHLSGCELCRAEAELIATLRRWAVAPPPGLQPLVLRALLGSAPRRRLIRRPALLAASLAAALLGGTVLLRAVLGGGETLSRASAGAPSDLFEQTVPGWPGANGWLAGGVVPEHFSEPELELLLAEFDS